MIQTGNPTNMANLWDELKNGKYVCDCFPQSAAGTPQLSLQFAQLTKNANQMNNEAS